MNLVKNIDENNFLYLRNPYILDKDVVRECCKGGYVQSFGRLLVESSKRDRRSLATIEANFPPEFDYDDEYDRTKKYLDQKANEVSIPLMVFSSLGSSAVEE